VALVNGIEIGRTATIADTSEPLWATEFHLPDELLLESNQPPKRMRKACSGSKLVPPPPPAPLDTPVSRVITLQVWDSATEGDPVMLGEVEVPPDLVQAVLSSSPSEGQDTERYRDLTPREQDDDRTEGKNIVGGAARFSGLRLVTLNIRSHPAEEPRENSTATMVKYETVGEENGSDRGILSLSLRRVASDTKQRVGEEVCELSQSMAETDRRMAPSMAESGNEARLGENVSEETKAEVRVGGRDKPRQCSRPPRTATVVGARS